MHRFYGEKLFKNTPIQCSEKESNFYETLIFLCKYTSKFTKKQFADLMTETVEEYAGYELDQEDIDKAWEYIKALNLIYMSKYGTDKDLYLLCKYDYDFVPDYTA